jgi:sensor histidine kinase regulating citrate/malate metabolism
MLTSQSHNHNIITKGFFGNTFLKRFFPTTYLDSPGIGLALVKGTVESYGGTIWIESSLEHGSVFSFTLPRHGVSHYEK